MQPMVNLALRAARNAGQDLARRLDRFDSVQSTDQEKAKFIADCTIGLEKNIIFELKKSLPEHNFDGRETGLNLNDEQEPTWQICVIDDVSNFRVGIPDFAIIISCLINNKTEHSVILNPMNNDEFTASRGRGAQLNNRRIRCSDMASLNDAIIGYTQPMGMNERAESHTEKFKRLIDSGYEFRCLGSNVLTIAYVAANRLQAALLSDVDTFSLNAGGLIAAEAGCLVADLKGEPRLTAPASIAVANARMLKGMLTL